MANSLIPHPEAILRTTDQKVRGSNPFKRTTVSSSDEVISLLRKAISPADT